MTINEHNEQMLAELEKHLRDGRYYCQAGFENPIHKSAVQRGDDGSFWACFEHDGPITFTFTFYPIKEVK